MSDIELLGSNKCDEASLLDKRHKEGPLLILIELDPSVVVDGAWLHECYVTGEVVFAGEMRETCTNCKDIRLQLVLRQEFVKRAHLFCKECTRCFDARYPDGSEALSLI
jgi:hypothetical protein